MKNIFIPLIIITLLTSCGTTKTKTAPPTASQQEDLSQIQNTISSDTVASEKIKIIPRPIYHGSATKLTDLVHTKLKVNFNWKKSQLNGVAFITCSPHFYSTDSLILDAQYMQILSVKVNGNPVQYKYKDSKTLRIGLDQIYNRKEQYTVKIEYIALPETVPESGSAAITSHKGLYFINPHHKKGGYMPQIWTQGETQSNSVWFPTIDRPNQKTTIELFMTVEDKYVTLSNGTLISSKENGDGTRTDHWKADKPFAPYLVMMAVGDFSIVKDSYTKDDGTTIPVNYFVEPEWAKYAKAIFGKTPEMIEFFSNLLGVEYPWDKYNQIVVREYVSGAMENVGATVLGDFLYKTKRGLIDGGGQSIIAHELFHHWFGDLVTIESWANLPLNESFANYSQYLWTQYQFGQDQADYNAEREINNYYAAVKMSGYHPMIWYDYPKKEKMFDAYAYNKGGRILHMLRCYLGDSAFFKSLHNYLMEYKYGTAELANLRMEFEKVSGEDLNWFFEQWFFYSKQPKLEVSHKIEDGQVTIRIDQVQDLEKNPIYKLPLKLGVYSGGKNHTYNIVVDKNINTFTFPLEGELQNIVIDKDRALIADIKHKNKPREWYVFQYYHATKYLGRKYGLIYGSRVGGSEGTQLILDALHDDFWAIRKQAISYLNKLKAEDKDKVFTALLQMAKNDKNSKVRAAALDNLSRDFFGEEYAAQTTSALTKQIKNDSSYLVISQALMGLTRGSEESKEKALTLAKNLEKEPSSSLKAKILKIYSKYGDTSKLDFMVNTLLSGKVKGYNAIGAITSYSNFIEAQSLKVQKENFYVFQDLTKKGGAYISAILPYTLMGYKNKLNHKINQFTKELESLNKETDAEKIQSLQKKIAIGNTLSDQVIQLIKK